jgi:hypothetical protein
MVILYYKYITLSTPFLKLFLIFFIHTRARAFPGGPDRPGAEGEHMFDEEGSAQ